jgi:hypothetical protein
MAPAPTTANFVYPEMSFGPIGAVPSYIYPLFHLHLFRVWVVDHPLLSETRTSSSISATLLHLRKLLCRQRNSLRSKTLTVRPVVLMPVSSSLAQIDILGSPF